MCMLAVHVLLYFTPPAQYHGRSFVYAFADAQRTPVLAIELVGNRFLRRMVRVLVATAVREAVPQGAVFASGCAQQAATGGTAAATEAAAAGEAAAAAGVAAAASEAALLLQHEDLESHPHCAPTAAAGGEHAGEPAWDAGALLRAIAAGDRSLTAPAAPAEGLCFLEAGYGSWPAASLP